MTTYFINGKLRFCPCRRAKTHTIPLIARQMTRLLPQKRRVRIHVEMHKLRIKLRIKLRANLSTELRANLSTILHGILHGI